MNGELLIGNQGLVGGYLVSLATIGTGLGIVAALALLVTRRIRPNIRNSIACIGLICMVVIPSIAQLAWPHLRPTIATGHRATVAQEMWTGVANPRDGTGAGDGEFAAAVEMSKIDVVGVLGELFPIAVWLWVGGAVLFLVKNLTSLFVLQKIKRSTVKAPEEFHTLLRGLEKRLGTSKNITLRHGPKVAVPMVVGLLRPSIVLPTAELHRSSTKRLEAILAHELAHIKRRDNPLNLLQALCVSVFFFNPIARWLRLVSVMEREFICDDLAVRAARIGRSEYAQALAELQLTVEPRNAASLAGSRILIRIERLMRPKTEARLRGRASLSLMGLVPITIFIAGIIALAEASHGQAATAHRVAEDVDRLGHYQSVLWVTVVGQANSPSLGPFAVQPKPGSEVFIEELSRRDGRSLVHITADAEDVIARGFLGRSGDRTELEAWVRSRIQSIVRDSGQGTFLDAEVTGLRVTTYAAGGHYVSILRLPQEWTSQQVAASMNSFARSFDSRAEASLAAESALDANDDHSWRLANLELQLGAVGALPSQGN